MATLLSLFDLKKSKHSCIRLEENLHTWINKSAHVCKQISIRVQVYPDTCLDLARHVDKIFPVFGEALQLEQTIK